jgi:hypothetical protein
MVNHSNGAERKIMTEWIKSSEQAPPTMTAPFTGVLADDDAELGMVSNTGWPPTTWPGTYCDPEQIAEERRWDERQG